MSHKEKEINTVQTKKETVKNDDIETTICNAFRTQFNEKHFIMEFAQAKKSDSSEAEINVVSKVAISIKMVEVFLERIVKETLDYEKEYNVKILPRDDSKSE